jgi:tetratricopeptide (TPR) repeat protein
LIVTRWISSTRLIVVSCVIGAAVWVSSGSCCVAQSAPLETNTAAQLRVWHEPPARPSSESNWTPRPLLLSGGALVRFDEERIQLRPGGGEEIESISMRRVVWIQPRWRDERARKGMRAFDAGQYAEAIEDLLAAIKLRPPLHEQFWLTGHLAWAAYQSERYPAALELVKNLDQSGAPSVTYALLPIRWQSRPTPPQAIAAAREVVRSESAAVRLVAASWLLSSPRDRLTAERALDALAASNRHPLLSQLAEVVRFRRTPVPQIERLAPRWIEAIERLPIGLQGGPWLTVADRLEAAGRADWAREYYLTVALLHRRPGPLAEYAARAMAAQPGVP